MVRNLLIILALVMAPVLVSIDMGQARAASHHAAAMAGCCDHAGASHHPASAPHGGVACTVSCANVAFFAVAAPGLSEMSSSEGVSLAVPQGDFPARASWPPPLRPPRF